MTGLYNGYNATSRSPMYIDREFEDYPYNGVFYVMGVDESKPLDEQKDEKIIILETRCDIQESSHSRTKDFIKADYAIYIPFDKKSIIYLKNGILFDGDMHGLRVNGKVVGIFPSQLNGIKVYVQDLDV